MSLCTCVAGATSGWSLRVRRAVAAGQGGRASLLLSHGSVGSKGWAGTTVKLRTVNNEDIVTCVCCRSSRLSLPCVLSSSAAVPMGGLWTHWMDYFFKFFFLSLL